MLKIFLKHTVYSVLAIFSLIVLAIVSLFIRSRKKHKIIFGTTPILNNKYWSNALKDIGIESETLMSTYYDSINKKNDYDKYFKDVVPKIFHSKYLYKVTYMFFVWLYIINNAKVFVMPFSGVVYTKYFWRFEYILFKINGIKTILLPYGADAYMYSRIRDKSLQNVLLINYPNAARNEKHIEEKVFFWSRYADFTASGFMGMDGMPRWDTTIHQHIQINTREWTQKNNYSKSDGKNGVVKIMHTPNHRGAKGTEYVNKAVDELNKEGLKVELVLLEKIPNSRVRELMQEVDILAEQFIGIGYALSGGIEDYNYQKVEIGNNCFIGVNCVITAGIKIGNRCLVGAGAVVTKSFGDNSIIAGVPAKKIGEVLVSEDGKIEYKYFKDNKNAE